MRQKTFKMASIVSVALLSGFIILFPFFGTKAQKVKKEEIKEYRGGDTPRRKTIIIKEGDLDKALFGLNQVNLDSINLTVQAALASVNFDEISKNLERSLKVINTDSIQLQVDMAMKSIDMKKMQADMNKAMAEMQKTDWQKEFQQSMKEMQESMKEMKLKMPEMKKEMEAAKKEMANAKLDIKDEMAKAKLDIEKARIEITELKTAITEMKKDGLIKEGESIKLEWKSGRLFINGKEQSEAVSNKYRKLENISFQQDNEDEEND